MVPHLCSLVRIFIIRAVESILASLTFFCERIIINQNIIPVLYSHCYYGNKSIIPILYSHCYHGNQNIIPVLYSHLLLWKQEHHSYILYSGCYYTCYHRNKTYPCRLFPYETSFLSSILWLFPTCYSETRGCYQRYKGQ